MDREISEAPPLPEEWLAVDGGRVCLHWGVTSDRLIVIKWMTPTHAHMILSRLEILIIMMIIIIKGIWSHEGRRLVNVEGDGGRQWRMDNIRIDCIHIWIFQRINKNYIPHKEKWMRIQTNIVQRRHSNGQQAFEKLLDFISNKGNAIQIYSKIL